MRLSDIRGERSLDIIADAMELAELVADDERFGDMMEEIRQLGDDRSAAWRVFCRHLAPIMREAEYKRRVVSIMASAAGVPYEEYAQDGPVLQDLFELVTSDSETLGFLLGSTASQGSTGGRWESTGDPSGSGPSTGTRPAG